MLLRGAVQVGQLGHAGQRRDGERGGLAGAGLGQADDVAALEQQRDGRGLDRGRLLVADVGQGGEDAAVDAEVGEEYGFFLGCCLGRRSGFGFGHGGGGIFGHEGSSYSFRERKPRKAWPSQGDGDVLGGSMTQVRRCCNPAADFPSQLLAASRRSV